MKQILVIITTFLLILVLIVPNARFTKPYEQSYVSMS